MPLNEGQYVLVEEAGLIDCVAFLKRMKLNLPILVKLRFENTDTDIALNAILYASLLRKGIIHGLYLTSKNAEDFKFQGMLAAEVFQVSGVRNVKSSIVSCPGCSRSNINLEFLSEEVRKRLSQNKLKVSIMGCAVNGYGEMMKSDLGLIGVGTGKVDIYREKVLVKSAVKESLVGDFIEEYIKIKQ